MPSPRTILHVDLDAFYAAVEVRENPALKGRPVVIGANPRGGKGRGVVSTSSYEARVFGVHSAMPISEAYRRCPQAVFLPPRMELYLQDSRKVMEIFATITELVEPLSIDEAFLDVTASERLFGDGPTIARRIQDQIEAEVGLTASIGIAPTKFVAKVASDLDKPCGLVVVAPDSVTEFLSPLSVKRLWGAGPKTRERLATMNVSTIGEVAALPLERLRQAFGERGAQHFYELSRGIDPRRVEPDRERKSLGREHTFGADLSDRVQIERTLFELVDDVSRSLRREGVTGRAVTVKLRTSDFKTLTRSLTENEGLDTTERIWPLARKLFRRADHNLLPIRLVGVSISHLGPRQRGLFESLEPETGQRIAKALDSVQEKYGKGALSRGASLGRKPDRPQ